jgi:hypothetical protein
MELVGFVAVFALLAAAGVTIGMIVAGWMGRHLDPPPPHDDQSPPAASPEDRL